MKMQKVLTIHHNKCNCLPSLLRCLKAKAVQSSHKHATSLKQEVGFMDFSFLVILPGTEHVQEFMSYCKSAGFFASLLSLKQLFHIKVKKLLMAHIESYNQTTKTFF